MPNYKVTIEQINDLLPQTQCGDCGYKGCIPYAQAILNHNENIDRCLPGGIQTLKQLGQLFDQDVSSLAADMRKKEKKPMLAVIREAECIGCTKCIQACPVDAIIGSAKQMHSVLTQECTGCGLCIPPCPLDCIDLLVLEQPLYNPETAKQRYQARNKRLAEKSVYPNPTSQKKTLGDAIKLTESEYQNKNSEKTSKKAAILAAVARVKKKHDAAKN